MNNLQILTLNCQKGHQPNLRNFLRSILGEETYDFLLLQESTPEILDFIDKIKSNYKIIRAYNKEIGAWSHISILFRNKFELQNFKLFPFVQFFYRNNNRPEFGFLMAKFNIGDSELIIGSLHTNGGIKPMVREKEIIFINKCLLKFNTDRTPVFFGGDFNSGLPWEIFRNNKIFQPNFINITSKSKKTCDSAFVEPVNLLNRISIGLAKLGIHFLLDVDHIYSDVITARICDKKYEALPVIVSDHKPLRLAVLNMQERVRVAKRGMFS